jgi:CHAT domain-containing protein
MLAKRPPAPQNTTTTGRLLLIGDPIYTRPEFQSLPHAREEMSDVAGHFDPAHRLVLAGADATPAAYHQSKPADFAYIHFVSHGVGSDIDPLDSAVILSANPGGDASYKLYAREILNNQLHADLVTISSCYGSGVRSYSGEGLVGLTWAFLHAGSHHVIGALWEVNDTSTPHLMGDLYDGLAHGATPAAALRAAKLAMIHRGDVFRKPYYWGSFQLYAGA